MSTSLPEIRGCGTALVTPFAGDRVDTDALRAFVDAQIDGGVDFLVPCGTTGESPTLTDDERMLVIGTVVEQAAGRVPVVAGTGTNDTAHSVAMTRAAAKLGVAASLAVTPYYNKPTQEGLYRHFRSMIDDGGIPALLYHVPGRSGIGIAIDTIARTFEAGGVVGLKETESVGRITQIRGTCAVPILSGDDGLTFPMLCMGAVGVISVASNVVPDRVAEMVHVTMAGAYAEGREAHEELEPLFRGLFCETNPIPVKAAAALKGIIPSGAVRGPLTPATDATLARLRDLL